jgi:hypothetical protein
MATPHGGQRAQRIRIYLRHHNDPEGKFQPKEARCESDADKGRTGCGATIWFYITFPNQKRMPFDGPPKVVENSEVSIGDGGIVAQVSTENVHFATCPQARGNDQRKKDLASGLTTPETPKGADVR